MAFCYHCGEEIEFINNGFGPIPIHPSGSCSGRAGGYGSGGGYSTFRSTTDGEVFEFPFITFPSYVNPNARCPVCGASVYFYQSPYGGRVFFDELGPPWPKHPCTDNPVVRSHFSSAEGRRLILATTVPTTDSTHDTPPSTTSAEIQRPMAAWYRDGWMPFVVTKVAPKLIGIEAEGNLFLPGENECILFRISQTSTDAKLYRTRGHLKIGCSLVQNTNPILSALNESPVLLKQDPDFRQLMLSSFILSPSGEVEEITLNVSGVEL